MDVNNKILCPECGGNLEYWKEYLVTKKQSISKNGVLKTVVKIMPTEQIDHMEGLCCSKCLWTFNMVNDIEMIEKYPHLCKWYDDNVDKIKV